MEKSGRALLLAPQDQPTESWTAEIGLRLIYRHSILPLTGI
jgi:hypothetical protein